MRRAIAAVLLLAAGLAARAGAEAAPNPHRDLASRAATMVRVQFVLNIKIDGANESEHEGETDCQLIDARGLVLCSNSELGGYITQIARMGRGGGVSASPSEIEIVLDGETETRPGRLLVRDTDRDLAWLHLEEPLADADARPFLDLGQSAVPEIGETVYVLRRLNKFLGAQPIVHAVVVGAVTAKPRRLFVPSAPSTLGFGLPVFNAAGDLVGVTVLQTPGGDGEAAGLAGGPMTLVGASLSLQEMIGGLILPAADLVKATELARETFAGDLADDLEEIPESGG